MDENMASSRGEAETPIWERIPLSEGSPGAPESFQARNEAKAPVTGPRRRPVVWAAASLIAVGAAAAGFVVATSGGTPAPGDGMAPADFVVSSTQNTLAQHTADVVFSGSVSDAGQTIPISGTGQADFSNDGFTATVTEDSTKGTIVERELLADGHFFVGVTADGQDLSAVTGGAQWVDVPVPSLGTSTSPGLGSVDPLSQIQTLETKGATVVPLGTSVIDGDTVSGFSVTPSAAEVQQNMQQEFATGQFSASQEQLLQNEAKSLGSFTVDVWFDASGPLRREAATISGGTSGATGKVDMTFQNFGTSVSIEPPAPGSTISFSQFMSDLQAMKNSTQE